MTINVYAAKTRLSQLLDEAAKGKEIVIARAGRPVAKLVPLKRRTRKLGLLRGKIKLAADFDAPLPKDIQRAFEGR